MRLFQLTLLFVTSFVGQSQSTEVQQLKTLLADLHNNFDKSADSLIRETGSDFDYTSKIILNGTMDNEITVSKDKVTWASYTAYLSDSCSLKQAKKITDFWRDQAMMVGQNFTLTKKDGNHKTTSGHPFYGYDFTSVDAQYKYWISISYAKRPTNIGYSAIMILGRQKIN